MLRTKATNTCFKYFRLLRWRPDLNNTFAGAQMTNTAWRRSKGSKKKKSGKRNYNCGIRAEWINVNETKVEKGNCSLHTVVGGAKTRGNKSERNNSWCKSFLLWNGEKLYSCVEMFILIKTRFREWDSDLRMCGVCWKFNWIRVNSCWVSFP